MPNQALLNNLAFEIGVDYWKTKLKGAEPLDLFTDYPRLDVQSSKKAGARFSIDQNLTKRLIEFSDHKQVALSVTLLSAYQLLLYRYTNQEDICVANVESGNKQVIRTEIYSNDSFDELLQRVSSTIADAQKHGDIPFEKLVEALDGDSGFNPHNLQQVMFLLHNGPYTASDAIHTAKADVALIINKTSDGLSGELEYRTDLYHDDTVKRIIDHYKLLLNVIIANPKKHIGSYPILSKDEEHQLLNNFNNTTVSYSYQKTVIDLFEEQVEKTPDNTAIIFENTRLNYRELNAVANQFGDYLRQNYQVVPDDLVGILMERSEWMIIAILGIMKAGGAYVPIAPDYPQERISYVVKDSRCKLLIDEDEIEKFKKLQAGYSSENQSVGLQPHHLAYCIYTSGSTGNPKGCLLQHNGLINRMEWMQKAYPLGFNDIILQKTTFTFDVSVWELLWWAIEGAGVCMLQPGGEKSPEAIVDAINKHKITVMHFVPSMLSVFLEYLEGDKTKLEQLHSLKQVFTSGEALTVSQTERFAALFPGKSLMNLYGPTEASIDVTYFDCNTGRINGTVPIGKPIDNTQIYIIDRFKNLLPVGAAGEICLGGVGLARGYLNRPDLTAEKFITNPFVEGERIYRTGDLGRWRQDGNIEYLGRLDDQVKINGFRIELGEITALLEKHPKVKDAVVVAAAVNGQDKELVAYTTGGAEAAELVAYLKEHLPFYMVPGYYVHLDVLPINKNGKADRKALPLPTERFHEKQGNFAPPVTIVERIITMAWNQILTIENIGIDDNFFDLGGTSLMAVKVINQVNKETEANLRLANLYQLPTIRELAHKIETNTTHEVSPVVLLKKGKGTPLFIFPPWSSYPTIFNEFTNNYKGENPLYGIIYTEDTENFPYKTVQDYAEYLIAHIKAVHPDGPYGLLGYSMGARTILEVAIQMQQVKDEVKLLGVISHFPAFPSKGFFLSRRIRDEIRVFNGIDLKLKFKYLKNRFPYFLKLLTKGNNDIQELKLEIDSQKKIHAIHELYQTDQKYNGDMVLLYETSPDGNKEEFKKVQVYRNSIFKKLWQKFVTGTIIVNIIDCKHIDFFKKPAVEEVAGIVQSYLK